MEVKLEEQIETLKALSKRGSLSILQLLKEKPKRYNELKSTVSSDRTLSQRLKELERYSLIEALSIKVEGRFFIHYKITTKGEEIFKKVKEITVTK